MRILIAIKSCFPHMNEGYHDAIRQSWALYLPDEVDLRFFLGGPGRLPDEVKVECDDGYEFLPYKTREICKWSVQQGYDFTFFCDNDTFLVPNRLLDDTFDWDYRGRFYFSSPIAWEITGPRFAFGGTGYWLSRRACEIVSLSTIMKGERNEDQFVGRALRERKLKVSETNLERWERWASWHYTKGAYSDYPTYSPATHWQTRMTNQHILGLTQDNLAPIDQRTFPTIPDDVAPDSYVVQINPFVVVAKMKNLFQTSTTPHHLICLAASLEIQKKEMSAITYLDWEALSVAYTLVGMRQQGKYARTIANAWKINAG